MLHIVVLFLKITGIVVLGLAGFLLLCLLLVLWVPCRYQGRLCIQEAIEGRVLIRGPAFLYRFSGEVKENRLDWKLCIFGIPVLKNKQKESTQKREKPAKKKKKPRSLPEKLKYTFHSFCDKIKEIGNNSKEWKLLLEKEVTKEAFSDLKKELGAFLRILKPDTCRGYVRFGTGDPAGTGQLLGLLSLFYFACIPQVALYPDFEEKCLSTELFLKGKVAFRKVFGCLLRIFQNKKINYVYKKIKKLPGGNKHGREE
jgi:hypothetical protein